MIPTDHPPIDGRPVPGSERPLPEGPARGHVGSDRPVPEPTAAERSALDRSQPCQPLPDRPAVAKSPSGCATPGEAIFPDDVPQSLPAGPAPDQTVPNRPALEWRSGTVPVSTRFEDPYFSLDGGMAEAQHVFLAGNDLPARFRPGFHIAELGLGTGLNLLTTLIAWEASGTPGALRYTAFEAFPLSAADIARALSAFPEAHAKAAPFLAEWAAGSTRFTLGTMEVEIVPGDARATLPGWAHRADAWFLDGFAPARNPELWSDTLLAFVAARTAPGGTFATYTAAGHVRRTLERWFTVTRAPGFARKRHMSRGVRADR